MGLDTTHNAWHGAYSHFNRWREVLAQAAGLPPLRLMEGYYDREKTPHTGPVFCLAGGQLIAHLAPVSWELYQSDPLTKLLHHSDCDGKIVAADCLPLANRLRELLPNVPGEWAQETERFIAGLVDAGENFENVEFH